MFGVTQAFLEEKGEWMSRDPGVPNSCIYHFRVAGCLLRFCWFDYWLVSAAFFEAVVGLEGMLRLLYDDRETAFKVLLSRAVRDGCISDAAFSNIVPLPKDFLSRMERQLPTYSEQLESLLPRLRNEHLHGEFRLSPAFLHLAIHVREAADAVWGHFPRSPSEALGTQLCGGSCASRRGADHDPPDDRHPPRSEIAPNDGVPKAPLSERGNQRKST